MWLFGRLFRGSANKMGEEGGADYQVVVCHGPTRHSLTVRPDTTLHQFMVQVEAVTQVLVSGQKIIHRGRNLVDGDLVHATLTQLGVGPDAKLMVLGRRHDPAQDQADPALQKVAKIEENVVKVAGELEALVPQVQGTQGVDDPIKLRKTLLALNEEFMRLLEQLDSISFEEQQCLARQRRKQMVQRIQQLMERSDKLHDTLQQHAPSS